MLILFHSAILSPAALIITIPPPTVKNRKNKQTKNLEQTYMAERSIFNNIIFKTGFDTSHGSLHFYYRS